MRIRNVLDIVRVRRMGPLSQLETAPQNTAVSSIRVRYDEEPAVCRTKSVSTLMAANKQNSPSAERLLLGLFVALCVLMGIRWVLSVWHLH